VWACQLAAGEGHESHRCQRGERAHEQPHSAGHHPDGDAQPLMRLRYGGSAGRWGFAAYPASKDCYQGSVLPIGYFAGAPADALD